MNKTLLSVKGDQINLAFDIVKVNKEARTVTGIATADNIDTDQDLVDIKASYEAFAAWRGNIREMHGPKAVGKSVSVTQVEVTGDDGQVYNGLEVTAYISKGAEDTWQKCLDGTLAGFSIGGRVLEKVKEFNKALNKTYTRILKYILGELSLVDSPANPLGLLTIVKSVNGLPELTDIVAENHTVFYCATDGTAKLDDNVCSKCSNDMAEIGYIESTDEFVPDSINKMIQGHGEKLSKSSEDNVILQHNEDHDKVTHMELTEEDASFVKKLRKFLFGEAEVVKESTDTSGSEQTKEDGVVDEVIKSEGATEAAEIAATVVVEASVLDELLKSVDEIKKDIGRTVAGSHNTVEQIGAVGGSNVLGESVTDQSGAKPDTFNPGIIDLTGKVEVVAKSLGEAVAKFDGAIANLSKRLEAVESSGAVKKSAVSTDDEVSDTIVKSSKANDDEGWGNMFVPQDVIESLGRTE